MKAANINVTNGMLDNNITVALVLELSWSCPPRSVFLGEVADRLDGLLLSGSAVAVNRYVELNIMLSVGFVGGGGLQGVPVVINDLECDGLIVIMGNSQDTVKRERGSGDMRLFLNCPRVESMSIAAH